MKNFNYTISKSRNTISYYNEVPHIIKYMGSKRNIMDFVIEGINKCYTGGQIVDLFAGSGVLSGALRDQVPVLSNDIQRYSAILSNTYLGSYDWSSYPNILNEIVSIATNKVEEIKKTYPELNYVYHSDLTLEQFNNIEKEQQQLFEYDFSDIKYHLFIKNYSGTYWSFEQCLWIDVIRSIAEEYKNTNIFNLIIACLMFAMSYNSQSTGHYAQYRDANTESSMKDILIYRKKNILPYFIRKFEELQQQLGQHNHTHSVVSMDYLDCLDIIAPNSTVYADPPYCFVHYSRFYHALETLVRYDYPEVKYKGRYRTDRHQSPFCIRTKVKNAFQLMFEKVSIKQSNLVLSYSDTGMIELDEIISLAKEVFGIKYEIDFLLEDYSHSTMGRKKDRNREVIEGLILIKLI
ncbi:DNA adenine methylase [Fictibacillus terranigra]|uniref:DNA adenine methylase n=1 Tax=Fictibacillus terranigra TaxID=3058424 RepID=A0ABT8EAH5_9BACL|nr:DNA adenine methylase [Fictibacillus sp. CENA-BCM004]MDN4074926.1 DNA adenine methylase [Fictibacillus sp. CENA-BCM004]